VKNTNDYPLKIHARTPFALHIISAARDGIPGPDADKNLHKSNAYVGKRLELSNSYFITDRFDIQHIFLLTKQRKNSTIVNSDS